MLRGVSPIAQRDELEGSQLEYRCPRVLRDQAASLPAHRSLEQVGLDDLGHREVRVDRPGCLLDRPQRQVAPVALADRVADGRAHPD